MLAAVAEILGDGHRGVGREPAHHRALVAGGDHHHRLVAVRAQRLLQELAHLAAPFADERDHHRVDGLRGREHRDQRRLAHARAGEDADALAGAERREHVDGAHPGAEVLADARAAHRRRRLAERVDDVRAEPQRAAPVDRASEGVDDAALPGGVGLQRHRLQPPGAGLEPRVDGALEGFHRGALRVDAHHLADLRLAGARDEHPLASFRKGERPPTR